MNTDKVIHSYSDSNTISSYYFKDIAQFFSRGSFVASAVEEDLKYCLRKIPNTLQSQLRALRWEGTDCVGGVFLGSAVKRLGGVLEGEATSAPTW